MVTRAIQAEIVAPVAGLMFIQGIAADIRADYAFEVAAQEVATACTVGAYALWANDDGGPSPALAPIIRWITTHYSLPIDVR